MGNVSWDPIKISIVILNYNGYEITKECIDSILQNSYEAYEIILVDNASKDGSRERLEKKYWPDKVNQIIALPENVLYAGGMNAGIRISVGDIIICLCNDTVVHRDWLREIALAMRDPTIGCANPKILKCPANPYLIHQRLDMSIEKIGILGLTYSMHYSEFDKGQCDNLTPDYASGCAMVLRRSVLDKVGLFDESFGMFWEDVDLSLRIKRIGYRVAFIPRALLWHRGGESVKKVNFFKVKWHTTKNRIKGLIKEIIRSARATILNQ